MQIPTKEQCELLLAKYNFPERKRRHVEKVTEVATFLGKRLSSCAKASEDKKVKGKKLNLDLVHAGGMLHDIDKGVEGAGVVHPVKGVEILRAEGYPEVARICETHTINAFLDPKTVPTTWEEKCVALADKMVKNEVIGVTERFRLWREEVEEELRKVAPAFAPSFVKTTEGKKTTAGKQVSNVSNVSKVGLSEELENWEKQREIIEKSYVKVKELEKEILGIIRLEEEEIKDLTK